jgi:hypothetical protein
MGASGAPLGLLQSRIRSAEAIRGRIEFASLAVLRYGFRGCDVAARLGKHGNSVALWLNRGLELQYSEPEIRNRLDRIDEAISSSA